MRGGHQVVSEMLCLRIWQYQSAKGSLCKVLIDSPLPQGLAHPIHSTEASTSDVLLGISDNIRLICCVSQACEENVRVLVRARLIDCFCSMSQTQISLQTEGSLEEYRRIVFNAE